MSTCWAFTLAYNEGDFIAHWVRHYRSFCERVTVYVDTDTNDSTASQAVALGADVRWHRTGGLDDVAFVAFAQDRYKEARGHVDWVVWVDADEILYHPRLPTRLGDLRAQGVTLPQVQGYQMVSERPPSGAAPIYQQIKRGIPAREYSKVCVFDPALDVRWAVGKHTAEVPGAVHDDGSDPLRLLHYRYLGEAWLRGRNARNYARMGEGQLGRRHGVETYPDHEGPYSPAWYAEQTANAQEVVGG